MQPQKNVRKLLLADGFAGGLFADFIILAKAAVQRAACKKHSAAAGGTGPFAADAGLLPVMQCRTGDMHYGIRPTNALLHIAVYPAMPRAQGTMGVIVKIQKRSLS